jgi:hypothetical protein
VDIYWTKRAETERPDLLHKPAELRAWADRTNRAEKAAQAPAAKLKALRDLKTMWIALGYSWPPAEGQLPAVVAELSARADALADEGKLKEGVKLLVRCNAAKALADYVGDLIYVEDVP